jgi:hypothetical protein
MESLPLDIFHYITSYLDLVSLFTIKMVCRSWTRESMNPVAVKTMEMRYRLPMEADDHVTNWITLIRIAEKEKLVYNMLTDSRLRLSILLLYCLPIYNGNKRYPEETDKVYALLVNHEEYYRSRTCLYTRTPIVALVLNNENKQFVRSLWTEYARDIVWLMCRDRLMEDNFFYMKCSTSVGFIDSLYEPEDNKRALLYYLHENMKALGYAHIQLDPTIKPDVDKGRDLVTEANRYKDTFTLKTPISDQLERLIRTPSISESSRFRYFDEKEWLDSKAKNDNNNNNVSIKISSPDTEFEVDYSVGWLSDTWIDLRKSKRIIEMGYSWYMRIDNQDIQLYPYGTGRFLNDVEPEQMIRTLDKLNKIIGDVVNTYFSNAVKKKRIC